MAANLEQARCWRSGAQQAPRKAWLLRAGDVLVTPGLLSDEFNRYVSMLTARRADGAVVRCRPPCGSGPPGRAPRARVRAHAG
ncbi:hypothetical protein AB0C90_35605 [Streptomyces sp. NPDC048550]|uniref:preATP grasp domain-containing protein n=1 Tax=unclassified Streptomyces TaxID=2593676 RepID=UPI003430F949